MCSNAGLSFHGEGGRVAEERFTEPCRAVQRMTSDVPEQIDGCEVLAYVVELADLPFTDVLQLNVGGEWLGRVPRLAICEWDYRPTLMLFHCDERWNSLGVQGFERPGPMRPRSVIDVMGRAERYYPGSATRWILLPKADGGAYAPSTDAELDQYWREQHGDG